MITAQARIQVHEGYESLVPVVLPRPDEVREFAGKLHAHGEAWTGEAFGWPAEYQPERPEPPLDSKMTFTPADFCMGELRRVVLVADVGARQGCRADGVR